MADDDRQDADQESQDGKSEPSEKSERSEKSGPSEKSEPSEERLEKLGQTIEHARRESDEGVHGSFYEGDEPMFVQSGAEAREDESDTGEESKSDDQTISP